MPKTAVRFAAGLAVFPALIGRVPPTSFRDLLDLGSGLGTVE
jgi:hypothetical protein